MMMSRFYLVLFAILAALSSAFTVLPSTPSSSSMTTTSSTTSSSITRRHYQQQQQQQARRLSMAGPAVLEPPTKESETIEKQKNKQDEESTTKSSSNHKRGGWAVRLFNDPMNKREFVAMCLSKITGLTDGQAYQVMMGAHQNGVAVVGRYDQERAELYRDSLRDNGLTVDMIPVEDD